MSTTAANKLKVPEALPVRRARIAGTGSYVPERVLSNADLEKMVDTSDQWILDRTGISERRIASESETTSAMAVEAAKRALDAAGISGEQIDMIILATITPDMVFPNTACLVQDAIGAKNAVCFDLEAACSGFLYSLDVAKQFVATRKYDTVLVIGAEKISTITDWSDRTMCVLFGDGAGAAVVRPCEDGDGNGLIHSVLRSDGALADLLKLPAGGSRIPASNDSVAQGLHYMKMDGREVFKHAVTCMVNASKQILEETGLGVEDIKLIIPHQANMRIIKAISDRLGGDESQYFVNLHRYGNTSAASIIVALDEAVKAGRLQKGDFILLVAFGGGFVWGASLLEWSF
ncbi:MAG: beta-ketoacyl-ACP synthase III [Kiritimatiellia bacterium]